MKLRTHYVEKPWGRTELPPIFGDTGGRRVGEVWFAGPEGSELPLLVKYIFTSERLSIQVHPNDEQARERGLPQGKSECWFILDAEEGATLGLGLKEPMDGEALRQAALDGSIEERIDWKPVRPGEFFFVPAGTVHAIGPGISLLEFQKNVDVTYRLYDYGRPRELHLDDAVAVARAERYSETPKHVSGSGSFILLDGPDFSLIHTDSLSADVERLADRQRWVMPLQGTAFSGDESAGAGECLLLERGAPLTLSDDAVILAGAAGSL